MPATITDAVSFLETQWSSANDNKVKGILAEVRLKAYLTQHRAFFGPGGWIAIPGKPTPQNNVPTRSKVVIIPRPRSFTWQTNGGAGLSLRPAELSAYNYFRQHGVQAYFADPDAPDEAAFSLPTPSSGNLRAVYPRPYRIELKVVEFNGELSAVDPRDAFGQFPPRQGNIGLRCHSTGRLNILSAPWDNAGVVSELFWFEYARYYFQIDYLLSVNDLDMYLIGASGTPYPVELKSKKAAHDTGLGDWFGIDMGPFAKLAFFTSNGMNTEAIYIVEEVDGSGEFVDWLAIRFTELVKSCSWVGQAGGTGMTGGASVTYKVPKAAFSRLSMLLPTL